MRKLLSDRAKSDIHKKENRQENVNYWVNRLTPALTALVDIF